MKLKESDQDLKFGADELNVNTGDNYINLLNTLINDEVEAVNSYNDAINKVNVSNFKDSQRIVAVLNHIRSEELEHINELKDLVSYYNEKDTPIDDVTISDWYDALSSLNENNLVKNVAAGLNKKVMTFAILTADNPSIKYLTNEERKDYLRDPVAYNSKKTAELKADLKDRAINTISKEGDDVSYRLPYIKINGRYSQFEVKNLNGKIIKMPPEHSFMLINVSLADASALAEKYKQQSFIFGKNEEDEHEVYTYTARYSEARKEILGYNQQDVLADSTADPSVPEATDFYSQSRHYKWSFQFSDLDTAFNDYNVDDVNEVWPVYDDKSTKEPINDPSIYKNRLRRHTAYRQPITEAKLNISSPEYFKSMLKAYKGLSKRNNGWACVYGFTKNNKFIPLDPIYKDDVKSLQDIVKDLKTKEKGISDVEVYTIYKDKLNGVKDLLISKGLLDENLDESNKAA